jgi:hypothetical protein
VLLPLILAVVVAAVGTTLYLLVFKDPGTSTASDASVTTSSGPTSAAATTSESTAPSTAADPTTAAPTTAPPPPETVNPKLAGPWTGEGSLTTCTGFSDACPPTLPLDATITCATNSCSMTIGGDGFFPARISLTEGTHRASGHLSFSASPTCEGVPVFADWSLTFTQKGRKLVGTYSETSRGSIQCGPTSAQWNVTLTRG